MYDVRGFRALPRPETRSGQPRRCGVEIEFSGMDEAATAQIIARTVGGHVTQTGPHLYTVDDSDIGTVGVELDTRYAKADTQVVPESVLDAARVIVPVEIITAPLPPDQWDRVIDLTVALREAGAKGTSDSLLAGFGIHFNPEVTGYDDPFLIRTIIAYGLLEGWLREWRPLNVSRRILPFVDPWPAHFIDALLLAPDLDLRSVAGVVHSHLSGRNYGLDLLPILHDFDPDGFAARFGSESSGARPAFHFRLPDCRLDEPGWSIADEWDRWWLVEDLAADEPRFDALCAAWRKGAGHGAGWEQVVSQHIGPNGERLFK
ncbi:amidoligase family protein [Antarctobacter sp.]|uniref:amidoligase family protein n=1 Tax=Antarctobacter sp. TaxID=1872577 RepID=UPI002B27B1B8|nr:amidoligase family protein [Antarctobacter sp.]